MDSLLHNAFKVDQSLKHKPSLFLKLRNYFDAVSWDILFVPKLRSVFISNWCNRLHNDCYRSEGLTSRSVKLENFFTIISLTNSKSLVIIAFLLPRNILHSPKDNDQQLLINVTTCFIKRFINGCLKALTIIYFPTGF